MGFYIELFCDGDDCQSGADNAGPQGPNRRVVATEARRAGWIKSAKGWLCPSCAPAQGGDHAMQQGEEG